MPKTKDLNHEGHEDTRRKTKEDRSQESEFTHFGLQNAECGLQN